MEDSSNSTVEEREEPMVSPAGGNLGLRTGHFIKPSIVPGSINETAAANIPRHALSSLPTVFEPRKWPLEVKFYGWRHPPKNWKSWIVRMATLHESTWRKAGILEAIMNSTYDIYRNYDLVFGVAEKWCDETKSFIFPWGEATITLEDVMVLGGYSVLGSPVFTPLETQEMKETWRKLNNARKEICKSIYKKASQVSWMKKFMHSDTTVEHEAFLALWLSRFVLPSSFDVVVESVFPIAIHLARGTRIALAPAVLAKIYGDLRLLKRQIVASTRLEFNRDDADFTLMATLKSPLTLVQVWIWERFLDLKPKPNLIKNGEPRFALWHGAKCNKRVDVRSVLESAKERFEWCPYVRNITDCNGAKFHGDDAMRISMDSSLNDELLSFARCLRASELVGLDCIEQYLPHRVALQFGMDQDIPCSVSRSNDSYEIAWADYNKTVGSGELYIPSRVFNAGFTARYLKWWKDSVLSLREAGEDVLEEQRSFGDFKLTSKKTKEMGKGEASTGFKMNRNRLKRAKEVERRIGFKMIPKKRKRAKEGTAASTQPNGLKRRLKLLVTQKEKGKKASSLKRLKNVLRPHESPPESSKAKAQALGSEVSNDDKTDATSTCSLFKPFKGRPINFVIQKELNNSPFPPGFPPKEHVVQAKGSVNDDMVIPSIPPGFPPKCVNIEDEVTPAAPGFPLKCITEDEVTPAAPPGFLPRRITEYECEPTVLGTPSFPPNHNIMEDGDSIDGDKLIATKILRSASKHEIVGNKESKNNEKSESYAQNLSEGSSNEDQQTVAEMLNSRHKLENGDCSNAGGGKNSLAHCQSSSSSVADTEFAGCREVPTTQVQNATPTEAASGELSRATIQDEGKSTAGRALGSNGSPDDKVASVNCLEGYGNSYRVQKPKPDLEARISRLEAMFAYIKATRNVKAKVINITD